jgi:hypothetical protein
MTAADAEQAAQQDGQAPEPERPAAVPAERAMGVIMVGLCVVGIGIGIDLASGGAFFPWVLGLLGGQPDDGG